MCSEFLTRLICLKKVKRGIHGIKVSQNVPAISHLMYANDLLAMCRANKDEASVIKKCFEKYCVWSGQKISSEKSSILFSKFTSKKYCMDIKEALSFKEMAHDSIYLGNVLVFSCNKAKDFKALKDRVNARLKDWSQRLLSKAGKATLIKSVIQALPTYTMSIYSVPFGVCNDLDSFIRKFWWEAKPNANGFLALKAWKDIFNLKSLEGWGFVDLRTLTLLF